MNTIIQEIGCIETNDIYIKREDLIPFSFGGNKARKAKYFFDEIDSQSYDSVVTYGSSSSNHCRIISNLAAKRKMECYIVSPEEASEPTFNSELIDLFGAKTITVPTQEVHDTIERILRELKNDGKTPYFIPGGGHGNLGTTAYLDCYKEICKYEKENNVKFDYIFHASGTGTTQAGLIVGKLYHSDDRKIIGISIARRNPYGRNVVLESVNSFVNSQGRNIDVEVIEKATIFLDDYVAGGYGQSCDEMERFIKNAMLDYGIPLDVTYTGKAMFGMLDYLSKQNIKHKKVLFIHTGGTPLFFDFLRKAF